jgi:hypothetical protein
MEAAAHVTLGFSLMTIALQQLPCEQLKVIMREWYVLCSFNRYVPIVIEA